MKKVTRLLVGACAGLAMTLDVFAQAGVVPPGGGPGGREIYPIAGSHLLWQQNAAVAKYVALHPEMAAHMRLEKTSAWAFVVGSTHAWYASDFVSNTQYLTASTCRAVGVNCYVFVEDSLWGTRVDQRAVDSVQNAFDLRTPANPSKGIFQMDVDAFGSPPDVDADPRIIILILNIRDGWSGSGGYIAGYFFSLNETTLPTSNRAEIYYIDANPGNLMTSVGLQDGMSTTAHEFQHMIHYNYDRNEISFVNEGCSLVAEVNSGYPIYPQSLYVGETDHYLLDWRTNDFVNVLKDYSRAARFTTYVRDQLGMGVFKPIVASTQTGIAGMDAGFQSYGTALRFNDLFRTWLVANVLDDTTVARSYGYVYKNLPKAQGRTYTSPNVSATDTVQQLAARYLLFKGSFPLAAQFTVSNPSVVIKAVEIGAASKRVLDVTPGAPFVETGLGTAYTEVDFVVMNTSRTTNYTYTYLASDSVTENFAQEPPGLPTAGFALEQNYPNPFNPSTTIQYVIPKASVVNLEVFDLLGREVVTLVQGQQQAGDHSVAWAPGNLPSGVYFYRLETAGFSASRKLLFLK